MNKVVANPVWGQVLNNVSRSGGYDWVLSSGEFGDNPTQKEVGAENIEVSFEKGTGGLTSKVIFSDDGKSMDEEGIKKFFTLGYAEYFNSPTALSKYGFGAKGGGFWIGDTITLYCKQDGKIIAAKQNFNEFPAYEPFEPSKKEIEMVNKKLHNSKHGTVVVCSELGWKKSRDLSKVKIEHVITKGWRLMYSYLIKTTGKHYLVEGKEIQPISYNGGVAYKNGNKDDVMPIPEEVLNNKETNVIRELCEVKLPSCETPILYESWHRSRAINGDKYVYDIEDWGMLIFRNGRCVTPKPIQCSKLFGNKNGCIKQKGFGCAIYITGEHDEAFGMTYLKVLNKLTEDCDEVIEALSKMTHEDVNISSSRYDSEGTTIAKKNSDEILKGVNKRLNKMIKEFLHTSTGRGRNPNPEPRPLPPDPPRPPRPKQDDDVLKMRLVEGGQYGNFISVTQFAPCRWYVDINCQHKLYEEFDLGNNLTTLLVMSLYEVCTNISLKVKFDETKEDVFDILAEEYDRIHEIKERFLCDMMSGLVEGLLKSDKVRNRSWMSSRLIGNLPGCEGVGVDSEEVLHVIDAEEPATVAAS